MKNTTIFLVYVMAVISCSTPTDSKPTNVFKQNHVKEVRTFNFEYKFGSVDSSSKKLLWFKIINSEGQSIKEEYYNEKLINDNTVYPPKYEFIPDTLFINRKYLAIEDGKIVETISRNSGTEFILSNKTVYDKKGRQTEAVVYGDEGNVEHKSITNYDGDRRVEIKYDGFGKVLGKSVKDKKSEIKYDAEGKILFEQILIKESKGYLEYSKKDSTGLKKIIETDSDSTNVYKELDSNSNEVYKIKTDFKNRLQIKVTFYYNSEPKNLWVYEYKFF